MVAFWTITMMHRARIVFHWSQQRAAIHSSKNQQFVLPARFDHQGDGWKENAWSVVIEPEGLHDESGKQSGVARFLSPSAPQDWLSEGNGFTVFEGALALGVGIVEEVLLE